jgi:hypothetical protein
MECRDRWARRWAWVQLRSYREKPPTHKVRLTVPSTVSDRELTASVQKFCRRLTRRGFEFFAVNEWARGRRHHHLLVRAAGQLTPATVGEWWRASCPRWKTSHYCQPVEDAAAVARYVVKFLRDDTKKELPPRDFRGRLLSYSKGYFVRPQAELWKEQAAEWVAARRRRRGGEG